MKSNLILSLALGSLLAACSSPQKTAKTLVESPKRQTASLCAGERVVCDRERNGRAEICVFDGEMMIPIQDEEDRNLPILTVAKEFTTALAKGDFKAIDKKVTTDESKSYTLKFRIDGTTFDGKSRLGITVQGKGVDETLSSCSWAPWQNSYR